MNAAHHPKYQTLTPLPVFDEIRELVRDPSVYKFLQVKGQGGYHEYEEFIRVVREWWLGTFDDEVRTSMGLVEEAKYEELFARYVLNVSHYLKKEKLHDRITGKLASPDEELMREVESSVLAEGEKRDEFRRSVVGRIGRVGPRESGKDARLSADLLQLHREARGGLLPGAQEVDLEELGLSAEVARRRRGRTGEQDKEIASRTVATMRDRFHYPEACTAECVAYLLRERYSSEKN